MSVERKEAYANGMDNLVGLVLVRNKDGLKAMINVLMS